MKIMLCYVFMVCCGTWAWYPCWPQQGTRVAYLAQVLTTQNSRQASFWLHNPCLKVLTMPGKELGQFGAMAFPLLIL